jgi:hypothetical protein
MTVQGARRSARAVLAAAAVAVIAPGCDSPGDSLPTSRHLRLEADSASTLGVDARGRFWVGRPGEAVVLDPAGAVVMRVPAAGEGAPELVAGTAGAHHLRAGDTLIAVSPATGERTGARAGFARVPVLADPRGRFILQGAGSGAVLGFHPSTLEPVWGWAARGARTTALAAAPEGDVVWQALAGEDGARILERDVQTGRIFIDVEVDEPVAAMANADGGDILLALIDGPRIEVLRLRSRGGELDRVWRAGARLDGDADIRLAHVPGARAVAVYRPGGEDGMRLLDAGDGSLLGSVAETPLDAAFAPNGVLYLLRPGEIRRVRIPR